MEENLIVDPPSQNRAPRERPGERSSLDRRYFVSREKLLELFADAPPIDYEQFREDLGACMDPTLRDWWGS